MGRGRTAARFAVVASAAIAALTLAAIPGLAAEVDAAELDGDVNDITVARGGTTVMRLSVTANGPIRCAATEENPATAAYAGVYTFDAGGMFVPSGSGGVATFHADASCNVTWDGAPSPQVVTAAVTATEDAPLGTYSLAIRPRLFTPFGSGTRLEDRVLTVLTLRVVEAAGDTEPPVVLCTGPDGAAGTNGWFTSDVTFACTADDDDSGLADPADAAFTLSTSGEDAVSTGARTVADAEGNVAEAGPYGPFDVDLSDPTADISPADGTVVLLNSDVAVHHACDDAVSGVASCEGTLADGAALDTSSVGSTTVSITAVDVAGRSTTVAATYHVVYDVDGFTVPPTPKKGHNAGRALPISWKIAGVSDAASFSGALARPASCDGGATGPATAVDVLGRVHHDGDAFGAILETDRDWTGCMWIGVSLDDGTEHGTVVAFR